MENLNLCRAAFYIVYSINSHLDISFNLLKASNILS